MRTWLASAAVVSMAACMGDIGGEGPAEGFLEGPPGARSAALSGARRLSRAEYDATIRDLLMDDTRPGNLRLPEDAVTPFDNDYRTQVPSTVLVEAAETLAEEIAVRALARPEVRAAIVPCTPAGPADAACMTQFVQQFGRRALRRPLEQAEIDRYLTLMPYAVEAGDFYFGVELVLRTMLQQLEFLYRIEVGSAVPGQPGVFRLNDFEVATRLSYLILGTTPDDALLDLAAAGRLRTSAEIRDVAASLLEDPRAKERVEWFHALWLGFDTLPDPTLTPEFRAETAALIDRIVFGGGGSYLDLFTSEETFVSATLADYYGLPHPDDPSGGWVSYGDNPRRGILSHGSFLAANAKAQDTSPTRRGKFIRERLLCQTIPPPPPGVDVDQPPTSEVSNCKIDRYAEHSTNPACAGCHELMDPVGHGLENYDRLGKFREHDDGEPTCIITGDGLLQGVGEFNGPAGLAQLLVSREELEACVVKQLHQFAVGRKETAGDSMLVGRLAAGFAESHALDELLIELVSDESFGYRRQDEGEEE